MTKDSHDRIAGQFFAIGIADTFASPSMTFTELEDEFPPLPPWSCVITDKGDF